jgi:tripartite-type tricarboxylate transporter receptor subunit TctC
VFWFHYTPDAWWCRSSQPDQDLCRLRQCGQGHPGKLNLGGSGLNSANHAAHERLNAVFGVKTGYVPFKGTGDMATGGAGRPGRRRDVYTAFAINNKGKVRALAVAMDKRHPLLPDVPTFKELGVDWVDGAYRGIGVPKSTPPEVRKRCPTCGRRSTTTRDEGAGRQERLRTGQRRRRPDGRFMKDKVYTEACTPLQGRAGAAHLGRWGRSTRRPRQGPGW